MCMSFVVRSKMMMMSNSWLTFSWKACFHACSQKEVDATTLFCIFSHESIPAQVEWLFYWRWPISRFSKFLLIVFVRKSSRYKILQSPLQVCCFLRNHYLWRTCFSLKSHGTRDSQKAHPDWRRSFYTLQGLFDTFDSEQMIFLSLDSYQSAWKVQTGYTDSSQLDIWSINLLSLSFICSLSSFSTDLLLQNRRRSQPLFWYHQSKNLATTSSNVINITKDITKCSTWLMSRHPREDWSHYCPF